MELPGEPGRLLVDIGFVAVGLAVLMALARHQARVSSGHMIVVLVALEPEEARQTDPSEYDGPSTNSSSVTDDVADPQDRSLVDKSSPRHGDPSEEFAASISPSRRAERYPRTLLDELDDEDLR